MSENLDALIARVAVLRSEERAADAALLAANQAHNDAFTKYTEADEALKAEIRRRVDALDPDAS